MGAKNDGPVGRMEWVNRPARPEVVARPCLVLDLEGRGHRLLHHLAPVAVPQRHDHLVNVEKGDVLVPGSKSIQLKYVSLFNIFTFESAFSRLFSSLF